ncbi:MAG: class I SAM-dependent methyltransferase [Wenzhouxiangella sp.]
MRGVEQIAWLYDGTMKFAPGLNRWRRELVGKARGRVLEVGCGTGLGLPDYAPDVSLVAIEPERELLERAARRRPDAGLIVASAESLPFADHRFDTVVSSLVFCSVPDVQKGLAEIKRVLKPDGTLLMLEHVRPQNRLGAFLLDKLQPAWTRIAGGCHPNRDTEAAVRDAGFHIEPDDYRSKGLLRRFSARIESKSPAQVDVT